jgi:hypothetical protein
MRHDEIKPKSDAPCACVLFPIYYLADGTIFYCDYYPTSCDDTPEAAYVIEDDSTPWPYQTCGCVLCFATSGDAKKTRKNERKFPGLPSVVDSNYQHDGMVPTGKAREFTTILIDPKLEYVQFLLGEETIYAKVLVFSWKTGQATDRNPKNLATRMRYIAFQTASVRAGAKCEAVTAEPIFSDENPCYAYQCVHQLDGGKPAHVMVLLAK